MNAFSIQNILKRRFQAQIPCFMNFILLIFCLPWSLIAQETVTDYDGNVYQVLTIGDQSWLQENLRSLHYSDGSPIEGVVCYNNDESLAETYGRLYDWNATMRNSTVGGVQGIAPDGWHIPTSAEWNTLIAYLGGSSVAGGEMKSTDSTWRSPNTGATNGSGFSGVPAGEYETPNSRFQLLHEYAIFWTSTQSSSTKATEKYLSYSSAACTSFNWYKSLKYSIRCIKDSETSIIKESDAHYPEEFRLFQNYPNPFNPSTKLQYELCNEGPVKLSIYSPIGTLVKTLVNTHQSPGSYEVQWNGNTSEGIFASSGVFIAKMSTSNETKTIKMLYIK
mgnify:CR=1 FL=1